MKEQLVFLLSTFNSARAKRPATAKSTFKSGGKSLTIPGIGAF
ncbi:hypothetical protein [Aulosira sp. FACHB-615]|nr:hypothetical protein [Aulosira sp. FACHB-615]